MKVDKMRENQRDELRQLYFISRKDAFFGWMNQNSF